jgi:hypothetical protein
VSIVEHTVAAVGIEAIVGKATSNWWAGTVLPTGYFLGREVAQAEYRGIETFGDDHRSNMPWNAVFDPRVWTTADQTANWLGPLVACIGVALLATRNAAQSTPRGQQGRD